ncbi:carbohydrate kinase family protein [Paenibacillus campi]|uniref:carbohydrate kinase family protein n=1 Tax=Paenibacillus campi TaxID=3106031 RepID=UPI002AFE9E9D|nr:MULTISPECIES: carbohydrate kinase family protein [unclassified Paenibacillus]
MDNKHYDVVSIGDANIDLIVAGSDQLPEPGQEVFVSNMLVHIGGGAALFSMAVAKLGLKVAFNGVLGQDYYGQFILDEFSGLNIDTTYIRQSKHNNTGISIAINPEQDRSFITYMGSNAEVRMEDLHENSMKHGRHVHMTGYQGSRNHDAYVAMIHKIKSFGATISFDVGWDDSGEWYSGIFEIMRAVDVFFLNELEALHYSRCADIRQAITLMSQHADHLVVKMGSRGAVSIQGGQQTYRSAYSVTAVDTTGAGDSFNAGYMYGVLTGKSTGECLQYGNACGALSVSAYGGNTGIPDQAGVAAFIHSHSTQVVDDWEVIA